MRVRRRGKMAGLKKNIVVTTKEPLFRILHNFHTENDERPYGADVDLVCKGGYIPMHSSILAAGSPILKEHFAQQSKWERQMTTVHLPDYSITDVGIVATCFYTGFCVFPKRQAPVIREIFEQLGVNYDKLTSCPAKHEEKNSFVRRYFDYVESDDEDMIEDGERVTLRDIPPEALVNLGRPNVVADVETPKEEKKKKPLQFVKTVPPKHPAATKVNRDGAGVKSAGESSSSSSQPDDEAEKESVKSDDSLPILHRKKRVHKLSDSENSSAGEHPKQQRKRHDKNTRSTSKRRKIVADSSEGESESTKKNDDTCDDGSSGEDVGRRISTKKTRVLRPRRQGDQRRNVDDSDSDSDRKPNLRKRPKNQSYRDKDSSESSEENESARRPKTREPRRSSEKKGKSDSGSSQSGLEEEDCHSSSSESDDSDSDTSPEEDSNGEGEIEESEKCYLRNFVVLLEKLPQEELEKYKRKQTADCSAKNSKKSSGEPDNDDSSIPVDNNGTEHGRKISGSKAHGAHASNKRVPLERDQPSNITLREPRKVVKKLPTVPAKETNGECVVTPYQALAASEAVIELPDPSEKRSPKEVLPVDVDAVQKWLKETSTCQHCKKNRENRIRASKCLKTHELTRCWICLDLVKSPETIGTHYGRKHSHDKKGYAKCPICQQLLPWNNMQDHIVRVHFNSKEVMNLPRPNKDDKQTEISETDVFSTVLVSNAETNGPISPDVCPNAYDSDEDSSRPLVTIKPPQLLFESDHEDEEPDSPESPVLTLELSSNPPASKIISTVPTFPSATIVQSSTASAATIVQSSSNSTIAPSQSIRITKLPPQLPWLGETLRNEERAATSHQTEPNIAGRINDRISTFKPANPRSQTSVEAGGNKNVASPIVSTNSSSLLQRPTTKTVAYIPGGNIALSGQSVHPRSAVLPSNSNPAKNNHFNGGVMQPRASAASGISSVVEGGTGSVQSVVRGATVNSAVSGGNSEGTLPTIASASSSVQNVDSHPRKQIFERQTSTAIHLTNSSTSVKNAQPTEQNNFAQQIANEIKEKMKSRPEKSASSGTQPENQTLNSPRPGTPAVMRTGPTSIRIINSGPSRSINPAARPVNTNTNLASGSVNTYTARKVVPVVQFHAPQSHASSVMKANNVTTVPSTTIGSTCSSRTLLQSNPTSVSTSTTTVLSSRNVVPGPMQGQLRSVTAVANPQSALVPFRANNPGGNNSPRTPPPPPSNMTANRNGNNQTRDLDTVAMPPPTGTVVLKSPHFVGTATIEGVPFKVFTRNATSQPHPEAVLSVLGDKVFEGRSIQMAPHAVGYQYPQLLSADAQEAINVFQARVTQEEAISVNAMHAQMNNLPPFDQRRIVQDNPYSAPNEPSSTTGGQIFRCPKCSEEYSTEESLRDHLCFDLE